MGDVLVIITGPDVADQTVNSKGKVTQITAAKDGRLLGYNFFNASEILPELKAERGQVFLSDEQVVKLNKALKEAGFTDELIADHTPKFVVGYVEKIEDHPKSDHLKITQTRVERCV